MSDEEKTVNVEAPGLENALDGIANEIDAGTSAMSASIDDLARAITPRGLPGMDAYGGSVASLTEAVMGVTGGLMAIAEAIRGLTR